MFSGKINKFYHLPDFLLQKGQKNNTLSRLAGFGQKMALYLLLIDGAFIFLLPILYMIIISFFTPEDLLDPSIHWVPAHFHWQNYLEAFKMMNYQTSIFNTLFFTVIALAGQTIFCSFAGYALARLKFPGNKWIFGAVLLVLVIPAQAMILPNYVFFAKLKLTKSIWPLVLPELLGNGLYGALFVFIFRQVFLDIPKDLEDAGAIDGAGIFKTFGFIVAPIARTAYITVGLFSFVWHWNEYTRPSYYLKEGTHTLTLALSFLFASPAGRFDPVSDVVLGAAVILVMAPVIFIYIFVQRYFVQGIQLTGIKG